MSGPTGAGGWQCPRCYELGRTPVRLVIARMDEPLNHTQATVCLRCADILWHRLRKVVRPLVREAAERLINK